MRIRVGPSFVLAAVLGVGTACNVMLTGVQDRELGYVKRADRSIEVQMSQTGRGNPDWSGLMAAIVLSIIPVIALLVVFGRQIVESLQTSGMK